MQGKSCKCRIRKLECNSYEKDLNRDFFGGLEALWLEAMVGEIESHYQSPASV